MKHISLVVMVTVLSFVCPQRSEAQGKAGTNETPTGQRNQLVGTWRLVAYSDFDSATGKWTNPYGEHPLGYFTYTKNGIVNLNVSSQTPLALSEDSARTRGFTLAELLNHYSVGYFGTYTIDPTTSTVTHHPKGGAIPWYVGTDQHRQFVLRGDTLYIGDPTFSIGRRVLIREE